jgi:Secretion system C-terminal sorting domain
MKTLVTLTLTTLLCFVLSTAGGLAQTCTSAAPSSKGVVPSTTEGNNPPSCLRFDSPSSGTFALDGFGNEISISISETTCTNNEGNPTQSQIFSWSVPNNIVIESIIVKGGNAYNTYNYTGNGITSDGNLHAPINASGGYAGLSHIDVCFHYKISVSKTAFTSYKRTYNWNIKKECLGDASLTLSAGQIYNYNFRWTASSTPSDSDFKVYGVITISNNTPFAVTVTSISDVLSDNIVADVSCSIPIPLGPGESVDCDYTASPTSTKAGINTVQVRTNSTKVVGNSAQKSYSFGAPSTKVDECITVRDNCVTGTTQACAGSSPVVKNYSCAIGPYACDTETTYTNTASFTAPSGASNSSSCDVAVTVPPCEEGCTLTQGYWKTHSSMGPARPANPTWSAVGGPNALFFISGRTWINVFWTSPNGNPYFILAHQYMAAVLNLANGASSTGDVDACLEFATKFFMSKMPSTTLSRAERTQVIACAGTLASYNEGSIGPGHCDEESRTSGNAIVVNPGYKINTSFDEIKLKLTPNPAQEQVRINLNQFIGMDVEIILSDRLGRVLYRQQLNQLETNTFDLQLSQLAIPSGMYQISVRSSELLLSEPLVIQGQR